MAIFTFFRYFKCLYRIRKVQLIRHAMNDKDFRACYEKNMVKEYTGESRRRGFLIKDMTLGGIMEKDGAGKIL